MHILEVIKILVFSIFWVNLSLAIASSVNAQEVANNQTTSTPITTISTELNKTSEYPRPECSVACEKCGINSKCIVECGLDSGTAQCMSNKTGCSIKCACKTGHQGEHCNEISTTSPISQASTLISTIASTIASTITSTITSTNRIFTEPLDFDSLKIQAWSQINADLDQFKSATSEPNTQLVISMMSKVGDLVAELLLNEKLEQSDVYKFAQVLRTLTSQNPKRFYLGDEVIESILKSFDDILSLNYMLYLRDTASIRSVLELTNQNFNKSALAIFDCVDELRVFSSFSTAKLKSFSTQNYKILMSGFMSPTDVDFPFRITSDSASENSQLIESISLNEKVLRAKYKNNSIKVSFKIYFNKNLSTYSQNETDLKRAEFYKQIEKPKNFFYDLTRDEDDEDQVSLNKQNMLLVSSNVLSASIYDPHYGRYQRDDYNSTWVMPKINIINCRDT